MAGMKFLNLKGWHPSNARNQKRIWIAEQKAEQKAQAERDAAAEVRKHAETHSFQMLAAAKGDAESARRSEQMQVGFLYAPPPGLEKVDEKVAQEMTEDDAVREFRRKMEKRSATAANGDDMQRPLERYVGRRPDEMLTIKEQVERFPFLKDAPVEGDYASNVKVNFKPMGRTLRNVKCMRCGEWGHQSGDRECALRDANPLDAARQAREDPMAMVAKLKKEGQLVLKQRALPLEMQQSAATGKGQEYEILLSDDDASADPEKAFLAGLSTKDKKSLLKKLRKQSKEEAAAAKGRDDSEDDSASVRGDRSKKRRRKEKHVKQEEKRRHDERQDRGDREDSRTHRARGTHSRHDRSRSRSRSRAHDSESRRRRRDGERRHSRSRSRSNSPRRRH